MIAVGAPQPRAIDEAGEAPPRQHEVGQARITVRHHQLLVPRPGDFQLAQDFLRAAGEVVAVEMLLLDKPVGDRTPRSLELAVEALVERTALNRDGVQSLKSFRHQAHDRALRQRGLDAVLACDPCHQQPFRAAVPGSRDHLRSRQPRPDPLEPLRLLEQAVVRTALHPLQKQGRSPLRRPAREVGAGLAGADRPAAIAGQGRSDHARKLRSLHHCPTVDETRVAGCTGRMR